MGIKDLLLDKDLKSKLRDQASKAIELQGFEDNQLQSKEELTELLCHNSVYERVELAWEHIKQNIFFSKEDQERVFSAFSQIESNKFTNPHSITCLQDYYGISDDLMKQIYSEGHTLYERKNYEMASHLFLNLSLINPFCESYRYALALAEQQLQNFEISAGLYLELLNGSPGNAQYQILYTQSLIGLKKAELISLQNCYRLLLPEDT